MDSEDQEIAKLLEDPDMIDRKFADRIAAWFDKIGITPNELTLCRIVLSLPMSLCFVVANYETRFKLWLLWMIAGSFFFASAMLCDAFDGSLARYQDVKDKIEKGLCPRFTDEEERKIPIIKRLGLRGSSHFGTVFDPFSDKWVYFFAIFPLGLSVVDHHYLWLSLLVAFILTLIRFRIIRRALEVAGKGAANRFGKYKIFVEVFAVSSLILLPHGPFKIMSANILIGTALVIGLLSLTGHLWLGVKKAKATAIQKLAAAKQRRASSSRLPVSK